MNSPAFWNVLLKKLVTTDEKHVDIKTYIPIYTRYKYTLQITHNQHL